MSLYSGNVLSRFDAWGEMRWVLCYRDGVSNSDVFCYVFLIYVPPLVSCSCNFASVGKATFSSERDVRAVVVVRRGLSSQGSQVQFKLNYYFCVTA